MCISLQEFFENPAFRADGLKIYPTLVIRGTGKQATGRKGGSLVPRPGYEARKGVPDPHLKYGITDFLDLKQRGDRDVR